MKNACCEMLKLVTRMLGEPENDLLWHRIQNLITEIGPTDSYCSALVARRQRNEFKPVPMDEPPPPF